MGRNWFILVQCYYKSLKIKDPTTLPWDGVVWSDHRYRDFDDTNFMNNVHYKYWTAMILQMRIKKNFQYSWF